jgi:chromosome segregation ATPase
MSTKTKRQRGNYSPASAAAVLDHRVVIVKSDQARSRLADFAAFIQGIEEERDTAVGKVCDLETSVRELESDNERIAVLENDVAYWRTDREEQKLAKENFEMDLRRSKDEIQRLNAVIASNGRELEANKKVHKTKDIQIDKLTTENMRLRSEMAASDSEHKDILAQLNARLLEKNSHCQQMSEALNAALVETKRIQASLAETDRLRADLSRLHDEYETLSQDLLDSERARERLDKENQELGANLGAVQLENIRLKEDARRFDRLSMLFIDAYLLQSEGAGHLLGSGKFLSLHSIARSW